MKWCNLYLCGLRRPDSSDSDETARCVGANRNMKLYLIWFIDLSLTEAALTFLLVYLEDWMCPEKRPDWNLSCSRLRCKADSSTGALWVKWRAGRCHFNKLSSGFFLFGNWNPSGTIGPVQQGRTAATHPRWSRPPRAVLVCWSVPCGPTWSTVCLYWTPPACTASINPFLIQRHVCLMFMITAAILDSTDSSSCSSCSSTHNLTDQQSHTWQARMEDSQLAANMAAWLTPETQKQHDHKFDMFSVETTHRTEPEPYLHFPLSVFNS